MLPGGNCFPRQDGYVRWEQNPYILTKSMMMQRTTTTRDRADALGRKLARLERNQRKQHGFVLYHKSMRLSIHRVMGGIMWNEHTHIS